MPPGKRMLYFRDLFALLPFKSMIESLSSPTTLSHRPAQSKTSGMKCIG